VHILDISADPSSTTGLIVKLAGARALSLLFQCSKRTGLWVR